MKKTSQNLRGLPSNLVQSGCASHIPMTILCFIPEGQHSTAFQVPDSGPLHHCEALSQKKKDFGNNHQKSPACAEFGHVCLANDDRSFGLQLGDQRRILFCDTLCV